MASVTTQTAAPATLPNGTKVAVVDIGGGELAGVVQVNNFPGTQPVSGPLTDTQLRATPVPISGTVSTGLSQPATDAQMRATPIPVSGTVSTGLTQPLTDTQLRATAVPVSGPLTDTQLRATAVPVSGPLTDVALRATPVPVSGTVSTGLTQPLTDTQLRATAVPVSGPLTDTQLRATAVPVSGPLTDTQLRATAVPVSNTNIDVALSTRLKPADTLAGVTAIGSITGPLPAGTNLIGQASLPSATLIVTAVSGANAAVTASLPAVAGQFHYISRIIIERVATTAIVGSAVLTYTSTNLGTWARTAGNAAPVGAQQKDVDEVLGVELRSAVANTITTIVAPAAGATGIVRITVYYRTAA